MKIMKNGAALVAMLSVPVCAAAHPGHGLLSNNPMHLVAHTAPWLVLLAAAAYLVSKKIVARQ